MSEVDYGKGRDLSVIWEFRKLISERKVEQKDQSPFKFWFTFYVYKVIY